MTNKLTEHDKLNIIMGKLNYRDIPRHSCVVSTIIEDTSIEFCAGAGNWHSVPFSNLPTILSSIPILSMSYTDFRYEITKLLNEYDTYCRLPDTSSRIDLEDSIDALFISLWKD